MKINQVLAALETFAPLPLQESYDNAGLQIGLTGEQDVTGALLCLDVTEGVVDEAVKSGFNLIVSHHPLLFRGLKRISADGSSVERIVMKAIRNNIAIISMHTNLDNAPGGVNHKMAEKLGLSDVTFLQPFSRGGFEGGSGVIGTISPQTLGVPVVEYIKTVFKAPCALCSTPPNLPTRGGTHTSQRTNPHGLSLPLVGESEGVIKIAICGGAGSFLLADAKAAGADYFVTGEMHYHEYFEALGDIQIVVLGHYETEQFTSELLQQILTEKCPELNTRLYGSTNPVVVC
ncbi:MAG: Nif3-like dinuclear metal center hexameric protein [Bacteroidaceae bacterium]|nr:Nif3-like dinuclear metal center hexameric protein [Bacteroidaceae bacterium]